MGKLHDQMQEDLLLKAYSPNTMRSYLRCARHFAKHHMRSPKEMGSQEVRAFLPHLGRDKPPRPRWTCRSAPSSSSTTSPSSDLEAKIIQIITIV